jgi:hypothetical protein
MGGIEPPELCERRHSIFCPATLSKTAPSPTWTQSWTPKSLQITRHKSTLANPGGHRRGDTSTHAHTHTHPPTTQTKYANENDCRRQGGRPSKSSSSPFVVATRCLVPQLIHRHTLADPPGPPSPSTCQDTQLAFSLPNSAGLFPDDA